VGVIIHSGNPAGETGPNTLVIFLGQSKTFEVWSTDDFETQRPYNPCLRSLSNFFKVIIPLRRGSKARSQRHLGGNDPQYFVPPKFCCVQKKLLQTYTKKLKSCPLKMFFPPSNLRAWLHVWRFCHTHTHAYAHTHLPFRSSNEQYDSSDQVF